MNDNEHFFLRKAALISRYTGADPPEPQGFRAYKSDKQVALQIRTAIGYAHLEVGVAELDAIVRALAVLRVSIELPSDAKAFSSALFGRPN